MAKFTANGAAFPGFGINGLSVTSIGQLDFEADVEVYTNGKIVAAEMTGDDVHHDFIVQRYFDGVSAGYGDLTKESQVEIFPNPVSDHLNIRMNDEKELSIAILNANCKEVYRSQLESKNNRIDVSDLPSGVYFLLFKQQDKLILCKIMAKI